MRQCVFRGTGGREHSYRQKVFAKMGVVDTYHDLVAKEQQPVANISVSVLLLAIPDWAA